MLERKYRESPHEREERERQESIRAEPDWTDIEASRAWLEERYPLLDDISLGSPLFRYMKACVKNPNHWRGRAPIFLASMLSFHEMMRWGAETVLAVVFDPKQEKLYPDYGWPNQDRVQEPNWSDKDASRSWLEQHYPLGPASIGSPLYQYMQECREYRYLGNSETTYLGLMLTNSEWERFCIDFPGSTRHRHRDKLDLNLLYPEYDNRLWPAQGSTHRKPFYPRLTRTKPLPPAATNSSVFAESYPPHLRRQSPSSSPSNKRKGDDGDDASLERPANKRRRNPSDLSGGVMMSAKPRNRYEEGHDGLKQENDTGSMPPPPRPQPNAASARSLGGHRNNIGVVSSGRQDTMNMTGTPPPRLVEARKDPRVIDLNKSSTEMQTAGHATPKDRSIETPTTSGPVQTSPVATITPARAHNRPIFIKTEPQHNHEAYLEDKFVTGDPGHQPYGQHTNGPAVDNNTSAAHEPANMNTSPLGPDPQGDNQAHVEENPDAMDIDSDDFKHQTSASSTITPLADPSRKRRLEEVEDEQPANFPSKKRRASSDTGGDDSLVSSAPMETSLVDPSRKESLESVEDAPPTTSSHKRKRTLPNSGGTEWPPSSPFDPSERSTPTPFSRSDMTPAENGTRGDIPDPLPLPQESPSYEDPTTVIFRPKETKGSALQSGSQSEATIGRRNAAATDTDDQPTADLRDLNAALNDGSEMQEPGNDGPMPPELDSQGEHHIHLEEDPDDMIIDSENHREQTTTNVVHSSGDRTEQTATGVVIPLQIPQRQPTGEQELSPDEDAMTIPVTQRKRKGGREPGTKGRKAPEPQLEQGKRKPPTKGRKNQQSGPEREQQVYVGRLRSRVEERKHRKPRFVMLEFKGRKAVQVRAN